MVGRMNIRTTVKQETPHIRNFDIKRLDVITTSVFCRIKMLTEPSGECFRVRRSNGDRTEFEFHDLERPSQFGFVECGLKLIGKLILNLRLLGFGQK